MQEIIPRSFQNAELLFERERVTPLSETNMFRAGVYAILSPREQYKKLLRICRELFVDEKLVTPEIVLENKPILERILSTTMKGRMSRVTDFSQWWIDQDFYQQLNDDLQDGGKKEEELRDLLDTTAPGMGLKCASLFLNMLGYQQVAPVDVHVLRYFGSDNPVRGISNSVYGKYETRLRALAADHEVTPAKMHKAIWCQNSPFWRDVDVLQMDLFGSRENFYEG